MNSHTIQSKSLGEIKYKSLGAFTAEQLNAEISLKTIPNPKSDKLRSIYNLFNEKKAAAPFKASTSKARNGAMLYRVIYNTTIPENQQTYKVSGLLAIPEIPGNAVNLVSWQHGTIEDPGDAPSNLARNGAIERSPIGVPRSSETLFNINALTGNGYAVAAADYIGNGVSKAPQAYAVKGATVRTTKDMLKASKAVLKDLGLNIKERYLNGWSQGGLNTQWLGSAFEKDGLITAGQAVVSGPSDLNATVQYWLNDYPGDPIWLTAVTPVLFGAYEHYYGIKDLMKKAIRPKYLKTSQDIYDDKIDWDEVIGPEKEGEGLLGLPTKPKDMLRRDFLSEYNRGEGKFYRKIVANTALETKYPEQNYFVGGGGDNIVPLTFSVDMPTEFQESLGSTMSIGVNTGENATHRSTFLASLYGTRNEPSNNILSWFADA